MFVVTKKINSQNIKKLCRTCLREDGEKMVCLFVGPADSSLAAKLTTLSCLKIWQGDELPEKLCDRCVTRAESALLFREQCRAADRALRQATSKEGYNKEKHLDCIDKPFKCFDCNELFLNHHELSTHRKLLHTLTNSSFINEQSSLSSSSSIEYNHMNIVETTLNFGYSTTGTTVSTIINNNNNTINNSTALSSSSTTTTTKYERPSCAFYCSLCNDTFLNDNQLMNHKLSHSTIPNSNNKNKKHKCPVCGKCFDKKSKLSTHEYLHTNDRPFKCINCPKKYTSKSKLNAHMRLHTKTNIYQCKFCDKVFSYPSYFKEHMKIHNQPQPQPPNENLTSINNTNNYYKCSMCNNKVYKFKKNLIQHIAQFHNDGQMNLFKCEICHKLFSQKYNLKIHMKIHSDIKSYECKYCFKKFIEKSNYNEHLRIHTKIKPFICLICHKTFTQSSHLKNHQVIHNSSRPHNCKLCDKKFKLLSHLNRHTSTIHKSYKCLLCNEYFTQAFSLKRHEKNKHCINDDDDDDDDDDD